MNRKSVVAGAIVTAKNGNIWNKGLERLVRRDQGRGACGIIVAAITVISLLVGIVRADQPFFVEGMLKSGGGVNRIRSSVTRINHRAGGHAATVGGIRRILRINARAGQSIYGLHSFDPADLREIVIIQTKSGPKHGIRILPESVSDAQAGREGFMVVVGSTLREGRGGYVESLESLKHRINQLGAARGVEKAKGGVVTQTIVEGQTRRDTPGIFGV